jgi:hypothetical protein
MSDRVKDNLTFHENCSVSYSFVAATDYTAATAKIAAKVGHKICIISIALAVTTDNAATQTFQDNAATPILVAKSKASPGLGPILWEFGPDGFELTEGKSFDHLMSAAGMAGAVVVTAYYKRTTGPNVS